MAIQKSIQAVVSSETCPPKKSAMDVIVSVIVLFSRTEGKYVPQDKGQKKKSLYVLLKTKVMY